MQTYPDINGAKIIFPEGLILFNDRNYDEGVLKYGKRIVITGYLDCSPCLITLKTVEDYLKTNPHFTQKVNVLFIGAGHPNEYFKYQLELNNFSFPVFLDSTNSFIRINKLENYDKTVLLVNEKDKLILVGSPFENTVLENLYKSAI